MAKKEANNEESKPKIHGGGVRHISPSPRQYSYVQSKSVSVRGCDSWETMSGDGEKKLRASAV